LGRIALSQPKQWIMSWFDGFKIGLVAGSLAACQPAPPSREAAAPDPSGQARLLAPARKADQCWGLLGLDTVWFVVDSTVTAEEFDQAWDGQPRSWLADTAAYPKTAGFLRLPLASGGFSDFNDQAGDDEASEAFARHTYLGVLPPANCYVVEYLGYETAGCLLVDRANGTRHMFSQMPSPSADRRWLACPYVEVEAIGPPYFIYVQLCQVVAGRLGEESLSQLVLDQGGVTQYGPVQFPLPSYCHELRFCWAGAARLLIEAHLDNGQVVRWAWQPSD
jgi:hypothetical protein